MKKPLIIVSHLGSGGDYFCSILNENERIQIFSESISFDHPSLLSNLFSKKHKKLDESAIYGFLNIYNKDFSCKSLFDCCKFIYLIREPSDSFDLIYENNKYPLGIFNYYCFRLRRIYEMARNTPGAVLINYQSLADKKDLSVIKKYLFLKEDLKYLDFSEEIKESKKTLDFKKKSQDIFEKYLFKFKKLDLNVI